MVKIDDTVKNETKYIALWVIVESIMMQAIFLIIGKWDITVLLGNLLSGFFAVINFLLMGITVQKAVEQEEKDAKIRMRISHTWRTFMLFAVAAIGVLLPCFNVWSCLIPFFFPRIAIAIRPLFKQ